MALIISRDQRGTANNIPGTLIRRNGSGGFTAGASTFTGEITSTLGTITADASVLDATATWNNAGVTFTGLKLNITDTASAAGSLLMDLQLGGNPRLQIQKTGGLISWGASSAAAGGFFTALTGDTVARAALAIDTTGTPNFGFGPGNANRDTFLLRDGAANTLALRNSTSAQTLRTYNTYTDASNYERATFLWSANVLSIATEQAGTGTARGINIGTTGSAGLGFFTANSVRWTINSSGHFLAQTDNTYDIGASGATRPRTIYAATSVVANGFVAPAAGNGYGFTSRGFILATGDGILRLVDNASSDFNRLQFGGTTASFPALKRYNNSLQVKLADDSDYTALMVGNLRLNIKKVSSNYTGLYNDSIIHCTTGVTVTLPPANTASGMLLKIKDASGAAPISNIVVTGSGSELIDGNLGYTITAPYSCLTLYSDGESRWFVY